jgi:hypothetical protein
VTPAAMATNRCPVIPSRTSRKIDSQAPEASRGLTPEGRRDSTGKSLGSTVRDRAPKIATVAMAARGHQDARVACDAGPVWAEASDPLLPPAAI